MARLPRLTLAGYPHHIILRGNNRQSIFLEEQDREVFLALLADHAGRHQAAVHAYQLMDNHIHLLVTPRAPESIPQLMQALGRSYVQAFNRRHGRTGTLWEGRYRCTVLDAETWLMPCMVYLDLNPVRAGLVVQPADYRWSSYGHWAGLRVDRGLTPAAQYWALGNTPFAREAGYVALVQAGITAAQQQAITAAALGGWALGPPEFVDDLQAQTPRRLVPAKVGRPRKIASKSDENSAPSQRP